MVDLPLELKWKTINFIIEIYYIFITLGIECEYNNDIIMKEIRALLSDLEAQFTFKLKHRLRPRACARCGTIRNFSNLVKFTIDNFSELFSKLEISLPLSVLEGLSLEYDFWHCKLDGTKMSKQCTLNPFFSDFYLKISYKL